MISRYRHRKWIKIIRKSRMFDANYYLHTYADVRAADVDPVKHYVTSGWMEGRNPNESFDTNYYLGAHKDVLDSKINPLVHYIVHGEKEGRGTVLARLRREVNQNGVRPAAEKTIQRIKERVSSGLLASKRAVEDIQQFELDEKNSVYIGYTEHGPLEPEVRVIAFYLPQYHPFPENDQWWGKGFTEWTNVTKARPSFVGHYQPHLPIHSGFYDLRVPEVMIEQAKLARNYGVHGFNFYYYWFAGKVLMQKPFDILLENPEIDINFCITWANENWTRRWDGLDSEVLIAQKHSPEDDLAFIENIAKYMRDPRYIHIDGRPLLIVYRPSLLPSPTDTAERWRTWCRDNGLGEIYLAYTQSFETADPEKYGFDAAIEFPPNNSSPPNITDSVTPLIKDFDASVYDWRVFVERSEKYKHRKYKIFRSVCPMWDNTARRKSKGTVFLNSTPVLYQRWLENAINETKRCYQKPDERLVFVNAWNEWAEGAHLEPDSYYGYAYLQATRDALVQSVSRQERSVLIVTHDCHPHGAQFLILETAKQLKSSGFQIAVLALGDGKLLSDFEKLGNTLNAKKAGETGVRAFLSALRDKGYVDAITSTVLSGRVLPLLKEKEFNVLSLIHELPGVIRQMKQEANAKAIALHADKVVFPAALVHERFCEIAPVAKEKVYIRPQGVLRKNPYKNRHKEAYSIVCKKHCLPKNCQIVLSVGFADSRKGADLFVEIAGKVLEECPNTIFIWIGHADQSIEKEVGNRIKELGVRDRVLFTGFDREPMAYYAAATVYALPSREDPFPNVVLESAEVGVPVVAFEEASGACDLVIEQGGRLAKYLNVLDFAKKVCELLETPLKKSNSSIGSLHEYALDLLHYINGFPRVSVVVPNYNYENHIVERLESIYQQSWPIYQLIILDDASTDKSVQVIENQIERSGSGLLVVNKKNSGSVFRQWLKGLSICKGDVVWIAEADDIAEKDFLKELAPVFKNPSVALAYSQSSQINESGKVLANNYLGYTKDISIKWQDSYFNDGRREVAEVLSIKNTIPNVSAVLFRRTALEEAFKDLGDDLYNYRVAGDWLIYIHTLLRGRIFFNRSSLNRHRRHTNSVTSETEKDKHFREVCAVQRIARQLEEPSSEAAVKAQAYMKILEEHFNINNKGAGA